MQDLRQRKVHFPDHTILIGEEVTPAMIAEIPAEKLKGVVSQRGSGNSHVAIMHLRGQAIDVRLADVPLDTLRSVALDLKKGGVGFYPESQFVHVDTGRVRRW